MTIDDIATDADLLELARRYNALLTAANGASWPGSVAEEFLCRMRQLQAAITETPADTVAGALAKARIVGYLLMQDGSKEEAELATSLALDLERLAGGSR